MSSDDRPVLVGMNNPYGADPDYALYPLPERATGWRIWQMLKTASPSVSMSDYRDAFDRRNFLTGAWSDARARDTAPVIRAALRGRTVVLFGAKVRDALRLDRTPCGSIAVEHCDEGPPFTYLHWVPHPSGLNPWYNGQGNREVVGDLLARLYRGDRGRLDVGASCLLRG